MKRLLLLLCVTTVATTQLQADWYNNGYYNDYDYQYRRPYRPVRDTVVGATDTAGNIVNDATTGAGNIVRGIFGR